jgi:hypothetical protein
MIYLEINNHYINRFGEKYLSYQCHGQIPLEAIYAADRVWYLNTKTSKVTWIKNRHFDLKNPVDPVEFLLVQIRSTPYV